MLESDHDMVRNQLNQLRFDLELLNEVSVMTAFKTTICGKFAPLDILVDEVAELNSKVTQFNKLETDTAVANFSKMPRQRKKPWVTKDET